MIVDRNATLLITDGTTEIDILKYFNMKSWIPSALPSKSQIWNDTPFMSGRRLVMRNFGNVIDTFILTPIGGDIDELILATQEIRRLLEKAVSYWTTDWQTEPVWFVARGTCETNNRFAIIQDYRSNKDDDVYDIDFDNIFENWELICEHIPWQEVEPDSETDIEVYSLMSYNGTTYGQEATTERDVHVVAKRNVSNITNLYVYDASAGTYTGNLIGSGLPYFLMPAVPAVGDMFYAGTDTTLANSGPFSNIIFDTVARWGRATAPAGAIWEYWNGAAWQTLAAMDNTFSQGAMIAGVGNPFISEGVNSVNWTPPSDWVTGNLLTILGGAAPNVTGYWIRLRVTAIGLDNNPPQQQNREVYTQTLPYVDIDDDQLIGDIAALIHTNMIGQSINDEQSIQTLNGTNLIMIGSRSKVRDAGGFEFSAYINLSDEQLDAAVTGIVVDITGFATSAFANDILAPSGRCITSTCVGTGIDKTAVQITHKASFPGTYRVFLRGDITAGAATDAKWKISFGMGDDNGNLISIITETDYLEFQNTSSYSYIDFGQVKITGNNLLDDVVTFVMKIISDDANAQTVNLYDLILMPVDEFSLIAWNDDIFIGRMDWGHTGGSQTLLHIDSINFDKNPIKVSMYYDNIGVEYFLANCQIISNGLHCLQSNTDQRVWFFFSGQDDISRAWQVVRLKMSRCARYLSMRGNR